MHGTPGQGRSWPILGLCASFRTRLRAVCLCNPEKKVQPMDQITNWMQSNLYELGSLTAQFTFLSAGLWFAGKILKTMRATQQQMGALLRLSMTDGLEERSKMQEPSEISESIHEPAPSVTTGSILSQAMERATSYSAFEKPVRAEAPSPSLSSELSGRGKAVLPIATVPIAEAPMAPTQDPT